MAVFVGFIVIFFVANGFILLEEETLILMAGIFWVDAAGGFIRETLTSEIENRGEVIEKKFKWYLETKRRLLELLIQKHEWREGIAQEMKNVYQSYLEVLVTSVLKNYMNQVVVGLRYERRMDILVLISKYWVSDGFVGEMEPVLEAIEEVEKK